MIEDVFDLRLDLCCIASREEAISFCEKNLEEYRLRFENEGVSEQTRITIENILTQEKYNQIYGENPKSKELEKMITERYRITTDFIASHKGETFSKYFYVVTGDVLSSSLQYLSLSKAMNEGMQIKVYYEASLAQDPDFSYCLVNYGQWLYHAPAIAGGNKKKALECFYRASEMAKMPFEVYYANFLISQLELDNHNEQAYKETFEKAVSAREGNLYLDFVRKVNAGGYTIFYYIANREKVEKELNL